jgi:hypothetical protein
MSFGVIEAQFSLIVDNEMRLARSKRMILRSKE